MTITTTTTGRRGQNGRRRAMIAVVNSSHPHWAIQEVQVGLMTRDSLIDSSQRRSLQLGHVFQILSHDSFFFHQRGGHLDTTSCRVTGDLSQEDGVLRMYSQIPPSGPSPFFSRCQLPVEESRTDWQQRWTLVENQNPRLTNGLTAIVKGINIRRGTIESSEKNNKRSRNSSLVGRPEDDQKGRCVAPLRLGKEKGVVLGIKATAQDRVVISLMIEHQ